MLEHVSAILMRMPCLQNKPAFTVVSAKDKDSPYNRALRHRVRLAIEAAEIEKQEIARQMKVLPSRISRLVGEEHTVTPELGYRLCLVLGVRIAWLFGGEGPMYEATRPIALVAAARDRQAQRDQQRKRVRARRAG